MRLGACWFDLPIAFFQQRSEMVGYGTAKSAPWRTTRGVPSLFPVPITHQRSGGYGARPQPTPGAVWRARRARWFPPPQWWYRGWPVRVRPGGRGWRAEGEVKRRTGRQRVSHTKGAAWAQARAQEDTQHIDRSTQCQALDLHPYTPWCRQRPPRRGGATSWSFVKSVVGERRRRAGVQHRRCLNRMFILP